MQLDIGSADVHGLYNGVAVLPSNLGSTVLFMMHSKS